MARPRAWGVVVLTAAVFYAVFTIAGLALHDWNPLWFVWIGERYASGDPQGRSGYDGQFVYYIARDGWGAGPHLDNPHYRLGRILYPVLARALSGGNPDLLPWAMLAINAVAIPITTALLTRWLAARGVSRWYGLVYPLFVGTLMAYSRDLTEPLAYGLAFAGMVAWLDNRRLASIALLALAGLAREATLLFPAAVVLAEACAGRWRRAAAASLAALPLGAWEIYLATAHRLLPALARTAVWQIPPALFINLSFEIGRVCSLLFVGIPLLMLTPLAAQWLVRMPRDPIAWLLGLNILLGLWVSSGIHLHIFSASRTMTGVLMALLLVFPRTTPRFRTVVALVAILPTLLWLPPLLWWAPWTAVL